MIENKENLPLTDLEKEKEMLLLKRIEYWHRSTGLNRMCYKCPLLAIQCRGSSTERWSDCAKRNCYERKHGHGKE